MGLLIQWKFWKVLKISSTDGKSCSGDTPDIAWEGFQKKSCSKLWHGKRFSCRIDGVEFFGFKNTFVQRLLRELVANVGGTAEQSSQPQNISIGAGDPIDQLQSRASTSSHDSDLLKILSTSHLTGKRSRRDKNYSKQSNKAHLPHLQEICTKNASASNSKQVSGNEDLSASATVSESHNISAVTQHENSATGIEDERHQSIAERSMLEDSLCIPNYLKKEISLSKEDREHTWSLNYSESNVDSLHQIPEPSDGSRDAQGCIDLIPHERVGLTNVEQDLKAVDDADLCAPDTLDHADDSIFVSPENHDQMHLIVNNAATTDVAKSEILVAGLSPIDETNESSYNSSSEKYDPDSVGQEIAKSMMTVLLPRAIPLLKTFSRRKKKKSKQQKPLTHESKEEDKILDITMTDATTVEKPAEHSYSGMKNENMTIPCATSAVSISGNAYSVVPDTFDSDDPHDLLALSDASKVNQVSCSVNHHTLLQPPTNVNEGANLLFCHTGIRTQDNEISDVMAEDSNFNVLAPVEKISTNPRIFVDNISSINSSLIEGTSRTKGVMDRSSSDFCISQKCKVGFAELNQDTELGECDDSSSMIQIPNATNSNSMVDNKKKGDLRSNDQQEVTLNHYPSCIPKLFACYIHPMPISMVQLIVKDNEISICVKCGYSDQKESILFIYQAIRFGEKMGCPSLRGYMPIASQNSGNAIGRDIAVERSLIQLTPDAQSIVLLNNFKTPYCREGKVHCPCPACSLDCFEKNAVKIVKLNNGYASLVTRLETTQAVCCLLVCEPSFLLAAEEGGKLRLWVMNCEWSEQVEDCSLPTIDSLFPRIVDLNTIPSSASMVVGHNGYGEFALWDIKKRSLVSRFSSPGISVVECIPASMFIWQRKAECKEVVINEIMNATKTWKSERKENKIFSPEAKDVAIWLLISTVPDSDFQRYQTCKQDTSCWRLALLINNKVILGSTVEGSAASITCRGHGIIAGCDGSIYEWELTTGTKLEILRSFRDCKVSCIATSASNALAIATGDRLNVYLSS
ncbi:uncharacterized protein LOC127245435 isoform X2 [Andrographis paniculata]|uniref:uncharacterized protein LOC127245435 isoform X2 n=1 Tax=Andrographis paniculata TaxID=175694 RepID=UPI0021E9A366|nr:uncharacterized protein LOC127245435 isoform X2 [Andrographis paniculata]